MPQLRLAIQRQGGGTDSTGPHKVKMVSDSLIKGTDPTTGEERYEVRYVVEEEGENKIYDVPVKDKKGDVHYLVPRLAEVEEGETIILECVNKHGRNYISVLREGEQKKADDEIPIIEDGDDNQQKGSGEVSPDQIPF